jgi:cobalt-precorrin-5B (C1)-methyltransferase
MSEHPELREPDLPRTMKVRQKALRTGWTTGSCASAAAKAATLLLRGDEMPGYVEIGLPSGNRVTFAVEGPDSEGEAPDADEERTRASAVVVKDAGDDPDVTHGAHITATVSWRSGAGIELDGGEGVGVVTKPGLGLELGGPAINPVPRQMITQAVAEALDAPGDAAPEQIAEPGTGRGVRVVISVPGGEVMARKTTNKRLGILGGISILGTTGIVRPFSTASWRASVEQAVSVLAAQGEKTLVLCTGGRTERGAMKLLPKLPEVCFVEVGDFTGAALRRAVEHGVTQVVFVGMIGKLTKLASGVLMTHYTRSRVSTDLLGDITTDMGGPAELAAEVAGANTARHAYELWEAAGLLGPCGRELCRRVADVLERYADATADGEQAGAESGAADGPQALTGTTGTGRIAAQVVLVDFTGQRMIGMYGRLARGPS